MKRTRVPKCYHDLNVPLPRSRLQLDDILSRLSQSGYSVAALSHTVKGRVNLSEDHADVAIPFTQRSSCKTPTATKKGLQKASQNSSRNEVEYPGLKILKRLNIIIEDVSDMAHYSITIGGSSEVDATKPLLSILQSYDLIAFIPRNEAAYNAVVGSMSTIIDILTIDYSMTSSGRLPFSIRNADITQLTKRGITMELNYAVSISDASKRRQWIIAGKMLSHTNLLTNVKNVGRPSIILSSGSRRMGNVALHENYDNNPFIRDNDLGALALRSPFDLMNLCDTVLGWKKHLSQASLRANASYAVERGKKRKSGRTYGWEHAHETANVVGIEFTNEYDDILTSPPSISKKKRAGHDHGKDIGHSKKRPKHPGADAGESKFPAETLRDEADGFIQLDSNVTCDD